MKAKADVANRDWLEVLSRRRKEKESRINLDLEMSHSVLELKWGTQSSMLKIETNQEEKNRQEQHTWPNHQSHLCDVRISIKKNSDTKFHTSCKTEIFWL